MFLFSLTNEGVAMHVVGAHNTILSIRALFPNHQCI